MKRTRRGYLTVEVDLNEAIDEMSDDMLLQEVEDRKLELVSAFDPVGDLLEARNCLLRGRSAEALSIIERILSPKWSSGHACEVALAAARAARTP